MTEWGDPDIQATLDMRQAGSVPLQRCAAARGPCSLEDTWIPEEQYNQALERQANAVDFDVFADFFSYALDRPPPELGAVIRLRGAIAARIRTATMGRHHQELGTFER